MPSTTKANCQADTARGQVQIVSNTKGPLSTLNLLLAGVPVKEVIWFRRLEPEKKMAALSSWRGQLLLERVRASSTPTGVAASLAGAA